MRKLFTASVFAVVVLAGCGESVPSNPVFQDNAKITTGTQTSEPFVERRVPTEAEMKGCKKYLLGVMGEWGEVTLCPSDPEVAPGVEPVSTAKTD